MKKALFIIASSLFILTMPGCKKETESRYASLLKEKIWTGTLQYKSMWDPEPFSIKFSTDGSFSWHETKEDVSGTWKLDDLQLVLNFSDGKQLKAELTADSTMKNFIGDDTKGVTIVQSRINTNADINLDDIRWVVSGTYDKVEFSGSRFTYYEWGFYNAGDYYFNRQNGTMRVNGGSEKVFFVIFPDGETIWMMGNLGNRMLKKPI